MSLDRGRRSAFWALHSLWRAANVYLIILMHFNPKSDLLIEILLVTSLRRGLLVPVSFRGVAKLLVSGQSVLYGYQALIGCGSTGSV